MLNQQQESISFICNLYDSLILKKSNGSQNSISYPKIDLTSEESFFTHFRRCLQQSKNNIRNHCQNSNQIQESTSRKIINTLMLLNKDATVLLQQEILNLYMDFVQMKEKYSPQSKYLNVRKLIENIILEVHPLLYEFFVYRDYKKLHPTYGYKRSNQRTLSLTKKFSNASKNSTNSSKNEKPHSSTQLFIMDEEQIQQLRSSINQQSINELLSLYLNQYEIELDQLQEVCKICSKAIKMNHLQRHVEYCQKKYVIKQELASLQKKCLNQSTKFIAQENQCRLLDDNLNHVLLTDIQDINNSNKNEYIDILNEIVNVHRIGNHSLKKIQSQNKIRQNADKYSEIIDKLQNYEQIHDEDQDHLSNISIFITFERRILHLTNQLRTLQLEHQNLREIVSSSTIRPPSHTSTKISEKKSRFAYQRNLSKSSNSSQKCSKKCVSAINDQQFLIFQNFEIQSQGNNNIQAQDDQNFGENQIKSKKSLGNSKNVHFNAEQSYQNNGQYLTVRQQKANRKSRKAKSMVIFDHSDTEEENDHSEYQYTISEVHSQNTYKPAQSIGLQDFQILKFLGKGAFGKVYAARKKFTSDLYALKMIDIGEDWGHEQFQQIANQHQIFKKVAGQHLVGAPYCFTQGGVHVFMMEFMPGGDLGKVLQQEVYLQEDRAKLVLAEIVLAIEHLHNAEIIHRDLKPQNLVIDQRGHLKLTDFGLSEIKIQNKLNTIKKQTVEKQKKRNRRAAIIAKNQNVKLIGTPDYIAPQIINGISINNKSIDWWSLGVIAYEIMIGARPFCGNTIQEVIQNILKLQIQWPEIGQEEGMISQHAHDFISRLLQNDFMNRLGAQSVEEIKNHPFFDDVNWDLIKQQSASIMPNNAKIKELLQMDEDQELRKEIQVKADKKLNTKIPQLENFIRFDILGEKTVKQAKNARSVKNGTLRRLKSIKDIIAEKENQADQQEYSWFLSGNLRSSEPGKKIKSFNELEKKEKLTVYEV